ncbi:MAG: ribonuclease HII [Eggerthellaceae bacterium]|nr:ribonuclease HII [Eggerthellaceae bacterium]
MARTVVLPGKSATARALSIEEVAAMLEGCDRATFESCREALKSDTRKGILSLLARAEKRIAAEEAESARLEGMYAFESSLAAARGAKAWVGLDEVGRGPLAGPLAAGAVVLSPDTRIPGLNDSKKLTPAAREEIAEAVRAQALAWAVTYVDNEFIDAHGMVASLKKAFSTALADVEGQLAAREMMCDLVLLDGNPLGFDAREVNVVKGDAKCASIAAASIIAKVARDALMVEYAAEYPRYGWESNKGYASEEHMAAIERYGLSPLHRASFCTSMTQMSLF